MNILSMFDGISCGRVALERAGIPVTNYYASEIDKYAQIISNANYPDIIRLGDVKNWREWDLPKIDILLAGSPCQGFSSAGKGLNFNDPRSALLFEFVDVLRAVKPKYFLLENVKMKKEWQDAITELVGVEPILINSSLLSAQNRRRLYWTNIPNVNQPKDKGLLLADILETPGYGVIKNRGEWKDRPNKGMGLVAGYRNGIDNRGMRTGIRFNSDKYRKLTPLECERLQTLEDGYTAHVSNSQRYKALGNGWTVDVIAHILNGVLGV